MRVPGASYRLQVHADFTLGDAEALLDYLEALGITDLYLSPVFEARPGSQHGYDVTDPTRISEALGGREAFDSLAAATRARGMGLLLDIVPNHMAASELSLWWRDVLQRGRRSAYADFFDIDWGEDPGNGRVLLPLLGSELQEAIEGDELRLERDEAGTFRLCYFQRALPLRDDPELEPLLQALENAADDERRRITAEVAARQHYQLAPWQTAASRLGYRRFFDITDLAGVCVEREHVFAASHVLIRELVHQGTATGLRVDHVDGLRAPGEYLRRLRDTTDAFILVEKILARDESLPAWPVAGTTGYDFLNILNGLFIEPAGYARLVQGFRRVTGDGRAFEDVVHEKKHLVMHALFGGELARLTAELGAVLRGRFPAADVKRALAEITACMPVYRTYTEDFAVSEADRAALAAAFAELAHRAPDLDAGLVRALHDVLHVSDRLGEQRGAALELVLHWQQLSGPVMAKGFEDTALYSWTPLLSANEVGSSPAGPAATLTEFHARMAERVHSWPHAQSATATHDTKRGEDVRARLNVLSELADEWSVKFSAWVRRSVDQKAAAAEAVGLADDAPVPNAREENLLHQTLVGAWPLADAETESFAGRLTEYMTKALREAKESTSWHGPDQDYESALAAFVDRLLAAPWQPSLRREIERFAVPLAWYGALNSLSQTLIKITAPGFPDFYQGTELWSLVLVDPDNRRPVDYRLRAERLAGLEPLLREPAPEPLRALLCEWRDGTVKLYATAAALHFRRARRELYADGEYLPLRVDGERALHVVAFARRHGDQWAVTIAPRFFTTLCAPGALPQEEWQDTRVLLPAELNAHTLRDAFSGRSFPGGELMLRHLLADFPIALLG